MRGESCAVFKPRHFLCRKCPSPAPYLVLVGSHAVDKINGGTLQKPLTIIVDFMMKVRLIFIESVTEVASITIVTLMKIKNKSISQ